MSNADGTAVDLLPGGKTTTGPGPFAPAPPDKVFQATVRGTGAVTASVVIEGSVMGNAWVPLGTIDITGSGLASDGFPSTARWPLVRANVKAISGTGAIVTAAMGA